MPPSLKNPVLISSRSSLHTQIRLSFKPEEQLILIKNFTTIDQIAQINPQVLILDAHSHTLPIHDILTTLWSKQQVCIVITHDQKLRHTLKAAYHSTIVCTLSDHTLVQELPPLLTLIRNTPHLSTYVPNVAPPPLSNVYTLHTSITEIECCVHLITAYLFTTRRIDFNKQNMIRIGLLELLTNALEHGNLAISFDEKRKFLEGGGKIRDLIDQRLALDYYAPKKITFHYHIKPHSSTFIICDEGHGFNAKKYLTTIKKQENFLGVSGRGIAMAQIAFDSMVYSSKGNKVTATISHLHKGFVQ